jgi:hypothetical protein
MISNEVQILDHAHVIAIPITFIKLLEVRTWEVLAFIAKFNLVLG